jgi:predicted enzyme related to lactoylglutathione lyase
MPRPVHFEIHATEPEAVLRFYQSVFGWQFQRWGDVPYWTTETGTTSPGIDGAVLQRVGESPADGQPVNAFVVTVQVENLDTTLSTVMENGGSLALEKQSYPGVGVVAYVKDPDGNILGILEPEPGS